MPAGTTMSAISAFWASRRRAASSIRSRWAVTPTEHASVGKIIGPGFEAENVPGAIEKLVDFYIAQRTSEDETFIAAYRRLGEAPFKEALYGTA